MPQKDVDTVPGQISRGDLMAFKERGPVVGWDHFASAPDSCVEVWAQSVGGVAAYRDKDLCYDTATHHMGKYKALLRMWKAYTSMEPPGMGSDSPALVALYPYRTPQEALGDDFKTVGESMWHGVAQLGGGLADHDSDVR